MSHTTWNAAELRQYIRTLPPQHRKLATELVSSIDRSIEIFVYHLFTARDSLKGHFNEADPCCLDNVTTIFDGINSKGENMSMARIASEAHILACIYVARGLWDIFAQLVNVLLLNIKIDIDRCDIYKVRDATPPSVLKTHLDQNLQAHWFRYLAAFVNTAKHRQLVCHSVSVSFEEDRVGTRLGAFEYKGEQYPSYWGREVLEGVLSVVNELIVCCQTLNNSCIPTSPTR